MAEASPNNLGWPDKTVVGAYLTTASWPGRPPGPVVTTAEASGGSVTFTGLTEGKSYFAAAKVNGTWVVTQFHVGSDSTPIPVTTKDLASGLLETQRGESLSVTPAPSGAEPQDLLVYSGGTWARLAAGNDGEELVVRSDGTLAWTRAPRVLVDAWQAAGDGTTIDSEAIQSAVEAAEAIAGEVYFSAGKTYIANDIAIKGRVSFAGPGWGTVVKQPEGVKDNEYLFHADSGSSEISNNISVTFRRLTLQGRSDTEEMLEHAHLVALTGVSDVLFDGVRFLSWKGDAIYLGAGLGEELERTNERVRVIDCDFDGSGKENRNAISVIDGTGVAIRGCTFRDCTKSTMPGAIDIEPNGEANTISNISVRGCFFNEIGGNVGAVALALGNLAAVSATSAPHDIRVEQNVFRNTSVPFYADNAKGWSLKDSTLIETGPPMIGYGSTSRDGKIADNYLYKVAASGGRIIEIFNAVDVPIEGNTFDNCGEEGFSILVRFGAEGATESSGIDFIDNRTVGSLTTAVSEKHAEHTLDASTNVARGNKVDNLPINGAHFAGGERTESNEIASAETLVLPADGDVFWVTGTTKIVNIAGGWPGRKVTLVFESTPEVRDVDGNLRLAGHFNPTAWDTLTLAYIGEWAEVGRNEN
jgi:polygalacturonase